MKYPDVFFRSLATPIVFALIALGFHFFLRGHNAPGGGFIAGLIVAVAALLGRMARDMRLLNIRTESLVPVGLLLAVGTGVGPMFLGEPFLRSAHGYLTWPLIGRFEWSTAVLFDAGVFLVVVGTTITIIDLLAEDANLRRLGVVLEELPEAPMEGDDDRDESERTDDSAAAASSGQPEAGEDAVSTEDGASNEDAMPIEYAEPPEDAEVPEDDAERENDERGSRTPRGEDR